MTTPDHHRVRELFQKAVLLSEPQRTAFLDLECAGDSIHREAVEELLLHHSTKPLLMPEDNEHQALPNKETVGQRLDSTRAETTIKKRFVHRFTGQFRRERRLIWTLAPLAAVLLTLLGIWVHRAIHESVRTSLEDTMQAMLDQEVFALRQWLRSETELVKSWARSPELRNVVAVLRDEAENAKDPHVELSSSPARL